MSAREAEVLDALGDHLTNAQIAVRLNISVRTVESHVSSLMRKLSASDRRALATIASELAARDPVDGDGAPDGAGRGIGLRGFPSAWTTFVGRDAELSSIAEALGSSRLVTLVGPGGVGKTRVAVEAAKRALEDFSVGAVFVDLIPVSSEFTIQAVASALGVFEQAHGSLADKVHEKLRAGRVLVVLDNCEHVLDSVAHFTRGVLATCPSATVLATSRERLGVNGERVISIPPLSLSAPDGNGAGSEAEILFNDRASTVDGWRDDPVLVSEICRRLEGMPLAIELAAARSGSLGLDGLLAGLDDNFRLLSGPAASGDRHGSLRAVIEWSHRLLDEDEAKMFRRLGVFACSFDLVSAAKVCDVTDIAVTSDVIGRLTDKSLLVFRPGKPESRWRILDTVHSYASEQLEASGEETDVRSRHLSWAAESAEDLWASIAEDRQWQARFDAIADDLRAALQHYRENGGDEYLGFRLALSLGLLTYARRFLAESRHHLTTAVNRAPDPGSKLLALRTAGDECFAEMRGDEAFNFWQQACEVAKEIGDDRAASIVLSQCASAAGRCPALFARPLGHDEIDELITRARSLAPARDAASDARDAASDAEIDAYVALAETWQWGVFPKADSSHEALELTRRFGDPVLISNALDAASVALAIDGRHREASRLAAERLDLLDGLARHEPRVGFEVADIFHMTTDLAIASGDLPLALESAKRSIGDPTSEGQPHFAATHQVLPLALQGRFDEALSQAYIMREGYERAGSPRAGWMSPAYFAASMVYGLRGDEESFGEWLETARDIATDRQACSFGACPESRVALHKGDLDKALSLVDRDSMKHWLHGGFSRAIGAETAVFAGEPDAEQRIDELAELAEENIFIDAQLLRARGVLTEDPEMLTASVERWESIGARFERACTLCLVPERRDEGLSELSALRCPPPMVTPRWT